MIFNKVKLTLIVTIIFFVISLIIPNNKVYFVTSSLFILAQFFINKSVIKGFIFSYIPLSIIRIGQRYNYLVVPKSATYFEQYPDGRYLNFIFSPTVALLFSSVLLMFLYLIFFKKIKFNMLLVIWLFVLVCMIFSSFQTSYIPGYSMLSSFVDFGFFCLIILIINYNSKLTKKDSFNFIKIFFYQIVVAVFFESIITILQWFKRSTLGLVIEATQNIPIFGLAADESSFAFRPIGLNFHANMAANHMTTYLVSLLLLFIVLYKDIKNNKNIVRIIFVVIALILFSIILFQSRSVYMGMFIAFIIYYFFNKKFMRKQFVSKIIYFISRYRSLIVITLIISFGVLLNRAWYSFYSFSETGGIAIRKEMIEEAWSMIYQNLWWGVGTSSFIPAMYQINPSGVVRKFPESVHNGFMLFLAENGVFAFVGFIIFIIILLKKVWLLSIQKEIKWFITVGFFIGYIVMLFQPMVNIFNLYTVSVLLVISYYERFNSVKIKK